MKLWVAISDEHMILYRLESKYGRQYLEIFEMSFEGKSTQVLADMLRHQKNLFVDVPITQHLVRQATKGDFDKIKEFLADQGLAQQVGTYERVLGHFRLSYLGNPIQRHVYDTCQQFIAAYPAPVSKMISTSFNQPIDKIHWVFGHATNRQLKFVDQAPTTLGEHRRYEEFIQEVTQASGLACDFPTPNKYYSDLPKDGLIVIFSHQASIRRLMYLLRTSPTLFRRVFLIDFGVIASELHYGGLPLAGNIKGAHYMRYFVQNEHIQNTTNPSGFVVDGRAMGLEPSQNNPYHYHYLNHSLPQELGIYLKKYAQHFALLKDAPYPTSPWVSSLEQAGVKVLPESDLAIDTPPSRIYIVSQKPSNLERRRNEVYMSVSQERKYEELAERIGRHTQLPCALLALNEEWTNLPLDGMVVFFTNRGFFDQWRRLEVAKHPLFARKVFIVSFDSLGSSYAELESYEFAGKIDETSYEHYASRWMFDHTNAGFWGRKATLYPEQGFDYQDGYIFHWCDNEDSEGVELPEALGEYLHNCIKQFPQLTKV